MESFRSFITEAAFNRGDVGEVVLGAALTAKFRKPDTSEVTTAEVEQIVKEVLRGRRPTKRYKRTDVIEVEEVFDKILFRVSVPEKAVKFLKGKDLSKVTDLFKSSVKYVNGDKRLGRQAKTLRRNGKVDSIVIDSDGLGDQKGTKIDIKLTVNGKKTRNQISLKVTGGERFAQVSGSGFDKQQSLWTDGLGLDISSFKSSYEQAMKDHDPKLRFTSRDDPMAEEQKDIVKSAMKLMYQNATTELNKMFEGPDVAFMKRLIDFISDGIAKDDQRYIELVKLDKGSFKSIRPGSKGFRELVSGLDLVAEFKDMNNPVLVIKDKTSGKPLIEVQGITELQPNKTKEYYKVYARNYIKAPANSILYSV